MNKTIKFAVFILILTFSASSAFAQHCPFDGGMVIAIHLTDQNGEPFTDATNIKLVKKSKQHGKKVGRKTFLPAKENLIKIYGERNFNGYSEFACEEDCGIFGKGIFIAHLTSDEAFYKVGKDDDSVWEKKDFEIQITNKGKKIRRIDVSKDSIFTLCYHKSKWSDIVPIEITEQNPLRNSLEIGNYKENDCLDSRNGERSVMKAETEFLKEIAF